MYLFKEKKLRESSEKWYVSIDRFGPISRSIYRVVRPEKVCKVVVMKVFGVQLGCIGDVRELGEFVKGDIGKWGF
jgi:hypothetical protein